MVLATSSCKKKTDCYKYYKTETLLKKFSVKFLFKKYLSTEFGQ